VHIGNLTKLIDVKDSAVLKGRFRHAHRKRENPKSRYGKGETKSVKRKPETGLLLQKLTCRF